MPTQTIESASTVEVEEFISLSTRNRQIMLSALEIKPNYYEVHPLDDFLGDDYEQRRRNCLERDADAARDMSGLVETHHAIFQEGIQFYNRHPCQDTQYMVDEMKIDHSFLVSRKKLLKDLWAIKKACFEKKYEAHLNLNRMGHLLPEEDKSD
jgi:hypothetical protein